MKTYDLSGTWHVTIDQEKTEQPASAEGFAMGLPGTTSAAGIGPENPARETGTLTDSHKIDGCVRFSRILTVGEWQDDQVMLTMERTRVTTVLIDGKPVGTQNSLSTPHRYLLPRMTPGDHQLTVCVDNTDYPTRGGHLTSPDTQSNWNGITGEISLKVGKTLVPDIRICPSADLRSIHVTAEVYGMQKGEAILSVKNANPVTLSVTDGVLDGEYRLPEGMALWDELTPNVHMLTVTIGEDRFESTFGLRYFHAEGRKLFCNDREVFLRGKHDGLIFPLTGYAPTDVETWKKVLQTAKDYGINHYRFHTCCPPDAAFTAADELGIFMEPELPFWGTVAKEGEEGYDAAERAYLLREGYAILRTYGHHPSFVMMSMGNELWGSKPALNRMLADYRVYAPDKLYVSGSNNFQFVPDVLAEEDVFVGVRFSRERLIRGSYAMCDAPQGIVQVTEPESVYNYDEMIVPGSTGNTQASGKVLIQYGTGVKEVEANAAEELTPQVPVISHEAGQYEFFPDFREIEQYTGPLKARNFEVFRERLQRAGLWKDHERFFFSAGRLAIDCYRREIETFLRTRELAGFQLLDIQDFSGQGTALVGVLNAFMESKGLITADHWRRFCANTVVLGEFDRFVLTDGDRMRFGVVISECDPRREHTRVECTLLLDGQALRQVSVLPGERCGRLTERVTVDMGPIHVTEMTQYTVRLMLEDGTVNEYPVWAIPEYDVRITEDGIFSMDGCVRFVESPEQAELVREPVLVVPSAEGKLPAEYCTDFWCYPMFRGISEWMKKPLPVGTLGLCIDKQHRALSEFRTEEYTTPPWYRILAHAHCEPLDGNAQPIVQMIDNVERCQRLGILYEKEGYPHLTVRLWEEADSPEVRAFARSLLKWLV